MDRDEIDYTIHYRRYHDGSERNWRAMARYFRETLKDYLPADRQSWIIDVGCGYGFGLKGVLDAGFTNVVGFDSDPGQIEIARNRGLPARHVPVDETAAFLRQYEGQVSLIYAFDVLEHVPHDAQIPFLKMIAAALRPEGLLVLRTPNALSPVGLHGRYVDWTHHCIFCRESMEFVLGNAGLDVKEIRSAESAQPERSLPKALMIEMLKVPLRTLIRGWWRMVLASELGIGVAMSEPVAPNILTIAKRQ